MHKDIKTVSLVMAVVCGILLLLPATDYAASADTPLRWKMVYPFFHANVLHFAINVWCLLSVAFLYPSRLWQLITAYVVAVTAPPFLFSAPVVGLSGVLFALIGMQVGSVRNHLYFHTLMTMSLVMMAIVPRLLIHLGYDAALMADMLHAYCYIAGVSISYIRSILW